MLDATKGDWDEAIERLYDAVGEEQKLAVALGRFRPFFEARAVTFLTAPTCAHQQSVHIAACDVPALSLVEYHNHYFAHDEWVKAAHARGGLREGTIFRGSDLVSRRELVQSYFWKTFLLPYGVTDILCAITEEEDSGAPASFVTFHRMMGQSPYPKAAVPLLAKLAPHLRRALRLHRRLAPELAIGATLHELFQQAKEPMLYVARGGRAVVRNEAANRYLDQRSSLLRSVNGMLSYLDAHAWRDVASLVARLEQGDQPSFEVTAVDRNGNAALLSLRRIYGSATDVLAAHAAVAICAVRPLRADCEQSLTSYFGLTAAESRVARLLTQGRSPAQIAEQLHLSLNTVRSHKTAVLRKTGTSRQAELVARLLN